MCTHPGPPNVRNGPDPGVVVSRLWGWGGYKEVFSEEEGSWVKARRKESMIDLYYIVQLDFLHHLRQGLAHEKPIIYM